MFDRMKVSLTSSTERKLGVILQYSQMGLSILINLIYTPIMLRILGQSQYGIYNLSNSIISYLNLLSLGFGASYIRFYSRYKKDENTQGIKKLNGLFIVVFLIMGAVALICGLLMSANVSLFFNETYSAEDMRIASILMVFMSINLALSFPNSVFTAYVTAQEKFVFQKILNIVKTVISPLLTLPLLLLGYGSIGMVVITTIITIIADGINLFFCIHKLKMRFDFRHPDKGLFKEIAVFSSFLAINQIVDQINWATDKVVLGKFCTSSAVAVYAIGSQINTYYMNFSTAVSNVFVPQVNRIVASDGDEDKKNHKLTELFTKVGRVQFIILMLILTGFIFFGQYFILKWAGTGYENSYYVALLLIVPVTIPLIQNIGIEIQRAKNMHQFRSYVYLGMALLNIVISIFLAQIWQEIGAAFGTTISIVVANVFVMNWYYHKKLGIDMIYFWKEIVKFIPAFVIPTVVGFLLNIKPCENFLGFIVRVIIYTGAYCLSFYFLGMNDFERGQINKVLRKLRLTK